MEAIYGGPIIARKQAALVFAAGKLDRFACRGIPRASLWVWKKKPGQRKRVWKKEKKEKEKENNRPFRSMRRRVRGLKGPARNAEIRRKRRRTLSKRRETFAEWKIQARCLNLYKIPIHSCNSASPCLIEETVRPLGLTG
jgi:hypothetical protein